MANAGNRHAGAHSFPQRTFPIHDAMLSEKGRASVNAWIGRETDAGFRYLAAGETA